MQTVNFYIVLVAALIAGIGASVKEREYLISASLGLILMFVSLLFFALERRARVLVRIGEAALRTEEDTLANRASNEHLRMIEAANTSSSRAFTYGRIFYIMFVTLGLVGLIVAAYSAVALLPLAILLRRFDF
jgi:hypothetical protein